MPKRDNSVLKRRIEKPEVTYNWFNYILRNFRLIF